MITISDLPIELLKFIFFESIDKSQSSYLPLIFTCSCFNKSVLLVDPKLSLKSIIEDITKYHDEFYEFFKSFRIPFDDYGWCSYAATNNKMVIHGM